MKIILGSQSKGRKTVLERMGLEFEVMPADIDEKAIRFEDPIRLTLALSNAKADALIARIKEPALLITSDQVVVCNGTSREKPVNREEARVFLKSYAQHPAETVTSVVVTNVATGRRFSGTDIAKIKFYPLPPDVIESYIVSGDPFIHAGGFDHEHPVISGYIEWISGEEESITGLPKKLTISLMKQVEY